MTKLCPKCSTVKSVEEFYPRGDGPGYEFQCKKCKNDRGIERYKDPETRKRIELNNKEWRRNNPNHVRLISNDYTKKIRAQVLEAYGGLSACCGEYDPHFLAIDHINGGGNKHRKKIRKGSGRQFYLWLRKQGFPKDEFRLLCHSCNLARGSYGSCPHEDAWIALLSGRTGRGESTNVG